MSELILYHGTSSRHLKRILREGLLPRVARRGKGNWQGEQASRPDLVYLSRAFAAAYALHAAGRRSRPVVLKCRVQLADCYPDEDFLAELFARQGFKAPRARAGKTDPRNYHHLAGASLECLGTVSTDAVAPEDILEWRELPAEALASGWLGSELSLSVSAYRVLGPDYGKAMDLFFEKGIEAVIEAGQARREEMWKKATPW